MRGPKRGVLVIKKRFFKLPKHQSHGRFDVAGSANDGRVIDRRAIMLAPFRKVSCDCTQSSRLRAKKTGERLCFIAPDYFERVASPKAVLVVPPYLNRAINRAWPL